MLTKEDKIAAKINKRKTKTKKIRYRPKTILDFYVDQAIKQGEVWKPI